MYVYEFLFRGRVNGDTAWHVVLAEEVAGSNGKTASIGHGPLTPAQAEALGFPLAVVIAEINAATMITCDAAIAAKKAIEVERDEALAEVSRLKGDTEARIFEPE